MPHDLQTYLTIFVIVAFVAGMITYRVHLNAQRREAFGDPRQRRRRTGDSSDFHVVGDASGDGGDGGDE